jgi:hypothetical protein
MIDVDRADIARFAEALFRHCDDEGYVALRAFDGGNKVWGEWPAPQIANGRGNVISAAISFAEAAAKSGKNIVFCPPVTTFKSAGSAAEKDVLNGPALSIDCDEAPTRAREIIENTLGPATVTVASGGLWTDPATGEVQEKVHLHWRLTEPTRTFADHMKLKEARRLATRLVGADASAVPLVHPMRWPGSVHRKAEPRLARIINLRDDIEIELSDALELLRDAVAAMPDKGRDHAGDYTDLAGHQPSQFGPQAEALDIISALAAIPNSERDWKRWSDIGMAVWHASSGSAAGYAAFLAWSSKFAGCEPSKTRERWEHWATSPPTHIGAGTLFHLAREAWPGWEKPSDLQRRAANDPGEPPPHIVDPKRDTSSNGAAPGGGAAAATNAADWPEPADLLSPAPVPRFPPDFLPGAFGAFAESQAFDLQAPLDFVAIPLLIIAATAIGKDFRMAPKAHAHWTERACLWGACIGHVGESKTPAFSAAVAPIWPLQKKWREAFQEEIKAHSAAAGRARMIKKQWESDVKAALKKGEEMPPKPEGAEPPEPPVAREMITIDATQERIALLLMHNPRGVLLFRDELSGWFSSFNQYRPGADEQFYLQCHAGGPWLQHRVKGDVTIPDAFLAVFGGLQPDVVAAALARGVHDGKPDNGLTARFSLLAWPEPVADLQWVDNSPDRDLRERVNHLFEKLAGLDPERLVGPQFLNSGEYPPLRFTPEAQGVFHDWYLEHHQAQQTLEPEAQIKGHFAKYDGLFARLALVHHLLRHAQGEPVEPATVDAVTARAVRRFVDGYLRPHARKVYGHLGRDPGYAGAKKIGQWLINDPGITSFTAREVSRKQWAGLTGRDENTGKDYLRAALAHLDNVAGWVRAEDVPTGPQGGRPTVSYVVNPKIHR